MVCQCAQHFERGNLAKIKLILIQFLVSKSEGRKKKNGNVKFQQTYLRNTLLICSEEKIVFMRRLIIPFGYLSVMISLFSCFVHMQGVDESLTVPSVHRYTKFSALVVEFKKAVASFRVVSAISPALFVRQERVSLKGTWYVTLHPSLPHNVHKFEYLLSEIKIFLIYFWLTD